MRWSFRWGHKNRGSMSHSDPSLLKGHQWQSIKANICSLSPALVTAPYEWNIFKRINQYTIKTKIYPVLGEGHKSLNRSLLFAGHVWLCQDLCRFNPPETHRQRLLWRWRAVWCHWAGWMIFIELLKSFKWLVAFVCISYLSLYAVHWLFEERCFYLRRRRRKQV